VAADVDARWLISISVVDADDGASAAIRAGGELLEPVSDFDNRGRYALIKDSQGAVLMLLDARGGDPLDEPMETGAWGWAELWTDDVDGAVRFYKKIGGYESLEVTGAGGETRVILGNDDMARATIVPIPWPHVEPNWVPYVPVADAGVTLQRVATAGGAVLATMPESADDVRVALVMDPTGGVFAVQQVEALQ
jgi:predicted enzyme related to lactoylglutathione lyase